MIDHLVYAAPDLAEGVQAVESQLGVAMSPGGRHPGLGSHNALLRVGARAYFEVVAPDPSQRRPRNGYWFAGGGTVLPGLVAWCARSGDLDALAAGAGRRLLGPVRSMFRVNPGGDAVHWTLTMPPSPPHHAGAVPFFIDWGATPHPCASLPDTGLRLKRLVARSPRAEAVRKDLALLAVPLDVEPAREEGLAATFERADGTEATLP